MVKKGNYKEETDSLKIAPQNNTVKIMLKRKKEKIQ